MTRSLIRVAGAFLMMASSLAVVLGGTVSPVSAATNVIVVNSTSDRNDNDSSDDICRTDNGDCTLRAAIVTANARRGDDRIEFDIAGSGTKTIQVSSSLPDIYDATGRLTIDGYTQGDAQPNTAQTGSNARIRVQLQGNGSYGLRITSAENTVRGLAISGFDYNIAIYYEQADGNVIVGNFIGPDANGNQVNGSRAGVHIWLGPDWNRIGGPALADRNVISGNDLRGLLIEQGSTSRNTVQNNVIGLNPSLTDRLSQRDGLDIQWGTWGNLIGGENPGEGNLISGNLQSSYGNWGGIDLSHSSQNNLILGNFIGTLGDGNSVASYTQNSNGILMKDNAQKNYIADNVIVNSRWDGIQNRHNFTGPSSWVNNRIGVGANGARLPNARYNVRLNGHGDIYYDNIIAYGAEGGVVVLDETFNDGNTNFPPEQTLGNQVRYSTFYGNAGPQIDIEPLGRLNNDDAGDGDDGAHRLLNRPVFTGAGQGEIYGRACAGCQVEVYLSGSINPDGTIDTNGSYTGAATWMATAVANSNGRFSMADDRMQVGKRVWAIAIDPEGNTSEWTAGGISIPSTPYGIEGNPVPGLGKVPAPDRPALPGPYESQLPGEFVCSHSSGSLTWSDTGADLYYVFAITDGGEQYLGGHPGTSLGVPNADSYRVEHFKFGYAIVATCDGDGEDATGAILGAVDRVDSGPVAGVNIDLFQATADGARGQWLTSTSTAADGSYTFDQLSPQCYIVTFIAPQGQAFTNTSPWFQPGACIEANETSTLDATLNAIGNATTIITGTVDRVDGGAVAGVNIDLFQATADGSRGQWLTSTSTAADGSYTFGQLNTNCYILTFIAPQGQTFTNNSPWFQPGTCIENGQTTNLSATLNPAG
ncbi:MAG: SdrD B-like domain-containing protein [Acidimicrobiales bacterium]